MLIEGMTEVARKYSTLHSSTAKWHVLGTSSVLLFMVTNTLILLCKLPISIEMYFNNLMMKGENLR